MQTDDLKITAQNEEIAPSAGRTRRLSEEEERELARGWRENRCERSREKLVSANLGLVVAIARRYRACGVPLDELVAEGNLGLLRAVDRFDPERGARFGTYAAYWIRQGIGRAFAANSPRGRLGGRDRRDVLAFIHASRNHYSERGEFPTLAELAEALEWPTERVSECEALARQYVRPASIDEPIRNSERPVNGTLAAPDVRSEDDAVDAAEEVHRLLADLSPVERTALELRFGLHGVTEQGVERIAESLECTKREARMAMRMGLAKLSKRRQRDSAA